MSYFEEETEPIVVDYCPVCSEPIYAGYSHRCKHHISNKEKRLQQLLEDMNKYKELPVNKLKVIKTILETQKNHSVYHLDKDLMDWLIKQAEKLECIENRKEEILVESGKRWSKLHRIRQIIEEE